MSCPGDIVCYALCSAFSRIFSLINMITIIVCYMLFVVFGATFCQWIWEYLMLRKKLRHIPGPNSVPFLGMVLQVATVPREDRLQWFNDMCAQFKTGVILTWVGTKPVVIVNLPKYMEVVLSSSSLITKSFAYDAFKSWIGEGLVTSTGETWFNHRRMITPAFHPNVLEEYAVALRKKTEILINCIESKLNENPEAPINMIELASKYALDAVCETAMGVNINCQEQTISEYVEALHTFDRLSNERRYRSWLTWDVIFYHTSMGRECYRAIKTMQNFSSEVIERKQRERKNKSVGDIDGTEVDEFGVRKPKAFLDRLLDANENSKKPLSIREVREEVDTFMAAGHDTTGTAIGWALFAIGNEPEVQDKIRAEMKEVFGDETAIASTKQLAQLKYLDRVIKEVLRLYPSIPAVGRRVDKDIDLGEYRIPKNTTLQLNIFQLQRNPEVWENPDKFDPDRFLPENIQLKNRYAYIPFSSGLRICIGQKFGLLEMKIVLTEVLRRWRISSVLKPSEMKMVVTFILRPHDKKIQLYFTPHRYK